MHHDRPSHLVGIAVVRGGGVPLAQRRLPLRAEVTLGRRDRNGLELLSEWAPRDLALLTPVAEGWLVTNQHRGLMRVDTDWVPSGHVDLLTGGIGVVQRGETKVSWPQLDKPLSLTITVRTRRMDDARIPYAVDSRIEGQSGHGPSGAGTGSYLGLQDAPLSTALRYRLAVLFRHLLEGEPEPMHLLKRRAEFLGVSEDELADSAHRYRRRLNAVRGTDLDDLDVLGPYLVEAGLLTRDDLDP